MTRRPLTKQQRREVRAYLLDRDLSHLAKHARRLARKAGRQGITVDNVRRAAQNTVLLAFDDRAYLSRVWGNVMLRAGLEPMGWRRTERRGTRGGNVCRVWRAAA